MKNFLFICRSHGSEQHLESLVLTSFKNNYCNFDFGFFLLSLKCIGSVNFLILKPGKDGGGVGGRWDKEINNNLEKKYDAVIIDFKIFRTLDDVKKKLFYIKKIKSTICLYMAVDKIFPHYETVIDIIDPKLIYIPNLYKDYNFYKFKNKNLDKLRGTFMGLGFLNIKYNLNNYSFDNFKSLPKSNDIFFSGNFSGNSWEFRSKVLEYINKDFLDLKKIITHNADIIKKLEYLGVWGPGYPYHPPGRFSDL
jgi:hypothetical protein